MTDGTRKKAFDEVLAIIAKEIKSYQLVSEVFAETGDFRAAEVGRDAIFGMEKLIQVIIAARDGGVTQ